MTKLIKTAGIHHITLTVSDVQRARDFYTALLGFQQVLELPPRLLLSNSKLVLALTPPPDPQRAATDDRFDENRIGLDHVSFNVGSWAELEQAAALLDERGIDRGAIKDLGPALGIYVLAFRDPDNIQLELTAPYGQT
jgi:glyoxylase I family protein